jgi:YqzL-like protein
MVWLRDFSWQYFTMTGDIDAYLLYKQHQELDEVEWDGSVDGEDETGNTNS